MCQRQSQFDLYFKNIYKNLNCHDKSHEDLLELENIEYRFELVQSSLHTNSLTKQILNLNRPLRFIRIEFFILEGSITKLLANIELNPSGKINLDMDIFSLKFGNKQVFYRILYAFLIFYIIYYGYEKFYEILSSEFFSAQRLLTNLLDIFSLYLALMSIVYLNEILGLDQGEFQVKKTGLIFNFKCLKTIELEKLKEF